MLLGVGIGAWLRQAGVPFADGPAAAMTCSTTVGPITVTSGQPSTVPGPLMDMAIPHRGDLRDSSRQWNRNLRRQNIHITYGQNMFMRNRFRVFMRLTSQVETGYLPRHFHNVRRLRPGQSAAFAISPTKLAPAQTSPKTSRACRVCLRIRCLSRAIAKKDLFVAQGYHLHASVPPFRTPLAP